MSEKKEPIINDIDVSEYFINHYDNKGKLYAVEYKGNPLELQNNIKRLQEENEKLKKENKELLSLSNKGGALLVAESTKNKKYKQALEEIREIAKYSIMHNSELSSNYQIILQNIKEVLNDRD